ncbi:MAG: hypothetical protein IPI67_01535 [Myxococcales bacterium]|nr:hypothetical protein [Myxococcales bacterium]
MSIAGPDPAPSEAEAVAPAPAPQGRPKKPGKAFWGRFAIGHFVSYPVCFLTAAGALPYVMFLRRAQLLNPGRVGARTKIVADVARDLKLSGVEAAQVEIVLEGAMWVCILVFVLLHLAALPWSFAAAAAARRPEAGEGGIRRGSRIFAGTAATTVVLVALAGTAGWIWILTR